MPEVHRRDRGDDAPDPLAGRRGTVRDIVLIPAYMRPEYLALCLEHLAAAPASRDDKQYWVCQDMRFEDDCRYGMQLRWTKEVLDNSPLPVRYIQRKPHGWNGNSYNTMEAYKEAYGTEARYVYLVEEDVLVTRDFFTWHEAVQDAEPDTLCSIAYRCSRNREARTDIVDPAAYFTTARDYASIGVCWRREIVSSGLQRTANPSTTLRLLTTSYRSSPTTDSPETSASKTDSSCDSCGKSEHSPVGPMFQDATTWGGTDITDQTDDDPKVSSLPKSPRYESLFATRVRLRVAAPDFGDIEPYDDRLNQPFNVLYKEQHFE